MRGSALRLFVSLLAFTATPLVAGCAWEAGLAGAFDGPILALAVFDEGSGPRLFVGGDFLHAGGLDIAYLARWDGSAWTAVGSAAAGSLANGKVNALVVHDDGTGPKLYAGGAFHLPGSHVAAWNGSQWSLLGVAGAGQGTNDVVWALESFDAGGGANLYVGGEFLYAALVAAEGVARWDGAAWHALISPFSPPALIDGRVYALEVFDDGGGPDLYVGGLFTVLSRGAENLALWNGSDWVKLGTAGPDARVDALTVHDDGGGSALYAGGLFTHADAVAANRTVRWDGAAWSALSGPHGNGMNGTVWALAVHDDVDGPMLYAGGAFTQAGGNAAGYSSRWDGGTWSNPPDPSGMGLNQPVYALLSHDDGHGPALWVGGDFTMAGDELSSYLARWSCGLLFKDGFESGLADAWDYLSIPGGP